MLYPKSTKLLVIFFILLLFVQEDLKAQSQKKIFIITINTVTANDMFSHPYFNDLAHKSVIGLMNAKSSGKSNEYKPYLTLGSGQKSDASFDCIENVKIDSVTAKEYEEITLSRCDIGNIANLTINKLKKMNSSTLYNSNPGKLGSILKTSGLKRCFIGGFWLNGAIKSPAFYILMDEQGLVDRGEIVNVFDNQGISNDKVLEEVRRYRDICDVILVELGDIETLYANRNLYSEDSYSKNKEDILNKCSVIIHDIISSMNFDNEVLYILTPFSSDTTKNSMELLSPFIIYDGGKSTGISSSKSTRRKGIVTSVDFAPTICNFLDLSTSGFLGYTMEKIPVNDNVDFILKLEQRVSSISQSRISVIKGYAVIIIIVLLFYILENLAHMGLSISFVIFLIESILLVPFSFMIEGILNFNTPLSKGLFIMLFSILGTSLIRKFIVKEIDRVMIIVAISSLIITLDLLTGQNLLRYSIFSYDPIIGARFYGLGNEFLGVLIGCTIVMSGIIMEKEKKKNIMMVLGLYLIFILLAIGLPSLGCNVGGFITAIIGFTVYILLEKNINVFDSLKILLLVMVMASILFISINVIVKSDQAHLGRMFDMIRSDGVIYFYNIVLRKVNMALRITRYTIWTKVLILLIISSVIMMYKPNRIINSFLNRVPHFKNSIIVNVISSCAAIIFNDSGIVTASVMMLYTVLSMIVIYETNKC